SAAAGAVEIPGPSNAEPPNSRSATGAKNRPMSTEDECEEIRQRLPGHHADAAADSTSLRRHDNPLSLPYGETVGQYVGVAGLCGDISVFDLKLAGAIKAVACDCA
ncbi:MAG: hypothetical protein ACLFWB_09415, partial [Armatimonadota bacterium]